MKSPHAIATTSRTPFRALLIIVSGYLYMVIGIQRTAASSPWITGDWLINYADGFVRRGLIGEVCRQLHVVAGIDPIAALIAFKSVLYATFCSALLLLGARRRIGIVEVALLLSPAMLPFEVYDPLGSGRKEIALLAAFAAYVLIHQFISDPDARLVRRWQFWYLLILLPLLTLIHEGLFFFLPFFLAYSWTRRGALDRDSVTAFGIPYAAAAVALLVSWVFRGGSGTSAAMCSSIVSMNVDSQVCSGAVAALDHYDVYISSHDVARYSGLALLTLIPLFWLATQALLASGQRATITAISIACAATLPLYLVSEDWGRWMHITAVLIFLTILACKEVQVPLPAGQPAFAAACFATICVYVGSWELPHWIHSPLPIVKMTTLGSISDRGSLVALPTPPWPPSQATNFRPVSERSAP